MTETDKIKAGLRRRAVQHTYGDDDLLGTGSTLLNLACTGNVKGGFVKGHYHFFCGDTDSGKTWLGLSCFAEASIDPAFDDYRLIYDAVEGGALMEMDRYFGKRMAKRVEPPARDKRGDPVYSGTAESFYCHVADALDKGKPFVYVLDSQDGLSSLAEAEKFDKDRKRVKVGKAPDGSYGDAKAKVHSSKLRRLMRPLLDTGSILLILNQTRDSFSMFERKTYSGGHALLFYAKMQLWSSVKERIKRTVRGKKRDVGTLCRVQVKKNHFRPGVTSTVEVPIYYSHGISDVDGCVDFMLDEGGWSGGGVEPIKATGLGPPMELRREALIREIERRKLTGDLRLLVGQVWGEIESACMVKRDRRYD